MASDSKHQKFEQDRISNLPASLITHILSLIPTKYAVRTSSLSTFWNRQWTSITHLSFDDTLTPKVISTPDTKASFVNFVYRVLLHIKVACPDVFQLNCRQDYGVTHINSWVSAALSRHVGHIDLCISTDEPSPLPRCIFDSKHLVVLKLGRGFLLKVPMLISLDSLKILHLEVTFSDNGSLSRLVSSCPVLEELKLREILSDTVSEVNLSSITLKRLILRWLDSNSQSYRVGLNTPGLQSLEYVDCNVPDSYSTGIVHCLDRARIDLCSPARPPLHTMSSLAVGISHVMFLYLSKDSCKALHFITSLLPKFPRLIKLELEETNWVFLRAILVNSPELATLSFRYSYQYYHCTHYSQRSVPLCVSSSLKQIQIKNFRGEQMDMDIVRYFLEKSKCLNKLSISYPSKITKGKEAEISKKLLMLPRASASCVVLIT